MVNKITTYGTITKKELFSRVRRFCLWYCGNSSKEVKLCESYECPWWDIRLGNKIPLERPQRPYREQSWQLEGHEETNSEDRKGTLKIS